MARASYAIVDLGVLWPHEAANWRDKVFVVDLDDGMSVTNDAEAVYAEVTAEHPGKRFIYRDTMGRWDEIVDGHEFKPYHGPVPSLEVCDVCERIFYSKTRCTNRRCGKCHSRHCTEGGVTGEGHGRKWPEPVNVGEHEAKLDVVRTQIGARR